MEAELPEGTWIVIAGPCGRLIGRLDMPEEEALVDDKFSKPSDIYKYRWIRLSPAFEHEVGMQRIPGEDGQVMLNKGSVTVSPDMCSTDVAVHVNIEGCRITFFSEMGKEDREAYENFVKEARLSMATAKKVRRSSGPGRKPLIEVPNFMPPRGIRRGDH